MNMMNLNKPAETVTQPVFILRGVPYLPHYSFKHTWISPGREHECKKYSKPDPTSPHPTSPRLPYHTSPHPALPRLSMPDQSLPA